MNENPYADFGTIITEDRFVGRERELRTIARMNGSKRLHVAVGEARGLVDAVSALRAGNLGPVEILDECLERIEASESAVGAWIDAAGARRTAVRQAGLPREEARGLPLLGVPIGVKDIIDAAGLPTKAGSVLRADHRAQRDAPIVKILRDPGAIVLGKAETTQFATTDPARTRNPWNLDRSLGGSSAGSAAAVDADWTTGCGRESSPHGSGSRIRMGPPPSTRGS